MMMMWRSARRTPIGIDTDGRFVKAAQLVRAGGRWRLEAAASIPRAEDDKLPDEREAGRIAGVLQRQGFHGHEVVIAVPGSRLVSGIIPVTPNGEAEIPPIERARSELAAISRCDPSALDVACWDVPADDAEGAGMVLAVGCARWEGDGLLDSYEAAGLEVVALDVAPWAATRACAALLEDHSGTVALLDAGWSGAQLVLVAGGVVVYERTLAEFGMKRLHGLIGGKLDLEPEIVTYMLGDAGVRAAGAGDAEVTSAVRGLAADHVKGLASELRLSLEYASSEFGIEPIGRLLVHGEGAAVPGTAELLAGELAVAARVVSPLDVIETQPSLGAECRSAALMTAVGLARHPGA